jgi:hypothetical protein
MRAYRSKEQYIETLAEILNAREDFKNLEYHRHPTNGKEYLFMSVVTGEVFFFDITGYDEADIFHCIAQMECGIGVGSLYQGNG